MCSIAHAFGFFFYLHAEDVSFFVRSKQSETKSQISWQQLYCEGSLLFRSYLSGKAKPQRSVRRGCSLRPNSGLVETTPKPLLRCIQFNIFFGRMQGLLMLRMVSITIINKNIFQHFPISYWHYPSNYAKIKQKNTVPTGGEKGSPAETLSWHSTSPDVYVLRTHKHPPESRRRRCFDYNTPFANFQVMSVKMKKFF